MDPYGALLKCSQIASGKAADDGGDGEFQEFRNTLKNLSGENKFEVPRDGRFALDRTQSPLLATCRDVEQYMFQRVPQELLDELKSWVNPDWALWRQQMEMRKAYLKGKFQQAALRFMRKPIMLKGVKKVKDPFLFYVTQNPEKESAPVQKLKPKKKNKYGRMFQAAAKRLIVERKLANPNADPWDVFFYKSMKVDADDVTFKIDIDKSKMDAFLFEEQGEEPPSPIPDYETDIASLATNRFDLLALTPPPPRRFSSPPPEKPPKRTPSLPAIHKQQVLLPRRRIAYEPKEQFRRSPNRLELPRLTEVSRSKSQTSNVRWKITRVRHSPDGKTRLNRLFYLPDISQKPNIKLPLALNDVLPSWGFYDSHFQF
ncbi:hypothetical protein QR680_018068 [Steinernema hermaphroditum]|uniref:Uncharacterized protein n=1 Tax=Steinernema hermaphroditum TaxID=289476 RepID=A0AA39HJ09_9BILA|nr:hypothetical protein QR680_018068 [Steinernema hermaphroditum]